MKCPLYTNPKVKEKFNKLVVYFGGIPLTDEEFKNKGVRVKRVGINYFAANYAYRMWNLHDEDYIDAVIEIFENKNLKQNVNAILKDFNSTVLSRTNADGYMPDSKKKLLHFWKNSWYVTLDKNIYTGKIDREYLSTDGTELLDPIEFTRREVEYYIGENNLPLDIVNIDKNTGKISLDVSASVRDIISENTKIFQYSPSDDEVKSQIASLEQELSEAETDLEKLDILGKIRDIKCKYGIM